MHDQQSLKSLTVTIKLEYDYRRSSWRTWECVSGKYIVDVLWSGTVLRDWTLL